MRTCAAIVALAALALSAGATGAADRGQPSRSDGLVFRYYPGSGYRFQPLLSFGNQNTLVTRQDARGAEQLAAALIARGVQRGDALYWTYDFPFGGAPAGWTSGFTQAVAAEALARTARFTGDRAALAAADAAFRGLRETLLIPLAGGAWIREYEFTDQVILNAQLESILAVQWYARIVGTAAARHVGADLEAAALKLLPQFDLGCWGRYQLGGGPADLHYQTYHVDLLRRLAVRHPEPAWRETYVRWRKCLP